MNLPMASAPVFRGPSTAAYALSAGIEPSSVCSICHTLVEKVVESASCSLLGLAEFEAECNLALDLETEGLGTVICAAAGAALRYACKQGMSDPAKYVAGKACSVAC